ncbi:hypothetical protein DYI26_18600 [Halomonas litopenaei]|nr:hypothetical protein [Halomonas litopenaei]
MFLTAFAEAALPREALDSCLGSDLASALFAALLEALVGESLRLRALGSGFAFCVAVPDD